MMNFFAPFISLCIFFAFNISVSHAFDTGISGMARVRDNTFLVVNDRKNSHKKDQDLANTKPRLGIVTVKKKWVAYEDLYVKYPLSMSDMPPNDLEAVCALPHREHEYLVAESGYYEGRYGRVFHLRLKEKKGKWKGELISAIRPFSKNTSTDTTPKSRQIEGMSCVEKAEAQLLVIFATRGGGGKRGKLIWGSLDGLDQSQPAFHPLGDAQIVTDQQSLGDRDASDLFLEKTKKDQWKVWTIAVDDPGDDFGPFRSVIYSPGIFEWDNEQGLTFHRTKPVTGWVRDGVKVEALAEPAERVKGSVFSIGTEDEALGGMWQPLFQP